ncbi:hypothetical protein [Halosimplex salinum]|nr:hypothetical protein [Halosimplex salinum]
MTASPSRRAVAHGAAVALIAVAIALATSSVVALDSGGLDGG